MSRSLLFGGRGSESGGERRALNGGPGAGAEFIPPNSQAGSFGLRRRINLSRADTALQKVAAFASINLLATLPGALPLQTFSGTGQAMRPIPTPGWLLDLGARGHGTGDWIYQLVTCWGLRGNAVGLVGSRDSITGKPRSIELQHPDEVDAWTDRDTGLVRWRIRGKEVDRDLIWHRRMYPSPGRALGLSPIALHAQTLGLAFAAQSFGAQFFEDGGHPSAILTQKDATEIPEGTARAVKARFLAATRGNREPVVMAGGWDYKPIQIAPNESQFLETQKYTDAEVARIYGPGMPEILGYETGGSLTYTNTEQKAIDLLTYTLDPWFVRIERALSDLLPSPQYVRLNRAALLRTDILTRYQVHEIGLRNKFETINQVRAFEEMPPVEWGDAPVAAELPPPTPIKIES